MLTAEKIRSCSTSMPLPSSADSIVMSRSFWMSGFDTIRNRQQKGSSIFSKIWKICPVRRSAWQFVVAIGVPLLGHSAEVLDSSVTRDDGRYIMHTETVVNAPVSKVRALIMDYRNFPRFNADIKRVDPIEHLDDGGIRMSVRSSICIISICEHFDWVQDIRFLSDGDIVMTIVPNQGDFREGTGRWRLLPAGGGTRLMFDIDLTPKYWVPPVFGPWLMKKKLTEDAFEFAQGLEKMAISK